MRKQLLSESRKRTIDNYINARCTALQEGRELNEWEWPSLGDVYDGVAKGLSYAGNLPIIGKIPGAIGGGMQLAKGAYTGDKEMMARGGADILFSGVPGAGIAGKAIAKNVAKNMVKKGAKDFTGKMAGDVVKIGAKNVAKSDPVTNTVTAGPGSPTRDLYNWVTGGGNNQKTPSTNTPSTNTPSTNTPPAVTNTPTPTPTQPITIPADNTRVVNNYVPQTQQTNTPSYVPQTQR